MPSSNKLLTIGIATHDDFDGLFFTVQSIRMHHAFDILDNIEIIVIDNNPNGKHGNENKNFIQNWAKQKYIPCISKTSTSIRNEIFKHASGKYTLCLDSHVLIENGGVASLLKYFEKNENTKDLISGPLWYDDLNSYSTHLDPVWRDSMYGIWGSDKKKYDLGQPFEIPMMGLGLFACKTSEWRGFNEKFKGFGGEEGYIHEKFRIAGGKCICIPNLKWSHRFGRPNKPSYPNFLEDRLWNYFIGWLEVFKDPNHSFIHSIRHEFEKNMPKGMINNVFHKAVAEFDI